MKGRSEEVALEQRPQGSEEAMRVGAAERSAAGQRPRGRARVERAREGGNEDGSSRGRVIWGLLGWCGDFGFYFWRRDIVGGFKTGQ